MGHIDMDTFIVRTQGVMLGFGIVPPNLVIAVQLARYCMLVTLLCCMVRILGEKGVISYNLDFLYS
jgi:hypothetical protein